MPPRLARLLAVIAALAMVGGALYFVTLDSGGGTGSDGPDPTGNNGSGNIRIACVTELEAVCEAVAAEHDDIALTIQDAGTTEATLAEAGAPPFDAWITLDPWPGMVDAERNRVGPSALFGKSRPTAVASTPLAAVMPRERFAALVKVCPKQNVTWDCVSTHAGKKWDSFATTQATEVWGPFKVGVGDPDTAIGALFVGQIATSIAQANGITPPFGANELNPDLKAQLKAPLASSTLADTVVQLTDLVTKSGSYSLVASARPLADTAANTVRGKDQKLRVVKIDPPARADAVVAAINADESRASQITEWFTDKTAQQAFKKLGWTFGPPKGSNGMPDADVLAALRQEIA